MPIVIEPSKLLDHPAVRVWNELHPALPPRRLEIWSAGTTRKAAVYRLTLPDAAAPAVFAKRGARKLLDVERTIHESILPALPVPSPRFFGFREGTEGDDWLFLEDVGDRWLRPQDRAEAALAGSWLGRMHAAAAADENGPRLPDAGPGRYLAHLRRARERIRANLSNPALAAADVALLGSILQQLDRIEARWERLERACAGMTPTLVHGDFQTKNVRIREIGGRLELIPIDWEMAGWGIPVVDLADAPSPSVEHQVDLVAYRSAVRDRWPDLSPDDLNRLAAIGYLWRRLAAIDWEATNLRFPVRLNLIKPLSCFHLYQPQMVAGLERLAPWLD